jgi:hypothetical protein
MYFSLPEDVPPRPLGGTRVCKHWSAVICVVFTGLHISYNCYVICYVYVHIMISMNKQKHRIWFSFNTIG